ncbi:MAG: molybdopterin dinucleotide binding domain-containing protein [Methanoregula sp.]|uniref:molybdopterin dinucleotide binding domain-containing protein n=1 Tax=Methanoregula sp. TaxID=2052170 RepID=UPI003BB1BDAF
MAEKKITLNIITCRTIQQGVGMEAGKTSQKYFDACTIIQMHPEDFKRLGAWKNTNVKVTSSVGSVILKAVETREDLVPGLAHIPMGPWANRIVPAYTFSTGEPCFKGFAADVEVAANARILGAIEVLQDACGLIRK